MTADLAGPARSPPSSRRSPAYRQGRWVPSTGFGRAPEGSLDAPYSIASPRVPLVRKIRHHRGNRDTGTPPGQDVVEDLPVGAETREVGKQLLRAFALPAVTDVHDDELGMLDPLVAVSDGPLLGGVRRRSLARLIDSGKQAARVSSNSSGRCRAKATAVPPITCWSNAVPPITCWSNRSTPSGWRSKRWIVSAFSRSCLARSRSLRTSSAWPGSSGGAT